MENISVCVRVKPKSRDDENLWRIDRSTITSGKTKETFTLGNINI